MEVPFKITTLFESVTVVLGRLSSLPPNTETSSDFNSQCGGIIKVHPPKICVSSKITYPSKSASIKLISVPPKMPTASPPLNCLVVTCFCSPLKIDTISI